MATQGKTQGQQKQAPTALRCVKCEEHLPDQVRYCPSCREPVPGAQRQEKPRFCPKCGLQAQKATYRFCSNCSEEIPEKSIPWLETSKPEREQELEKDFVSCHQPAETLLYFGEHRVNCEWRLRALRRVQYAGNVLMAATDWFDTLFSLPGSNDTLFFRYGMMGAPSVGSLHTLGAPQALATKTMLIWLLLEALRREYLNYEGIYSPLALAYFKAQWHWTDEALAALRFVPRFRSLEQQIAGGHDNGLYQEESLYSFVRKYHDFEKTLLDEWERLKAEPVTTLSCGVCEGIGRQYNSVYSCLKCMGTGKLAVASQPAHRSLLPPRIGAESVQALQAPRYCGRCAVKVQRHDAKHCEACGGILMEAYRQATKKSWGEPNVYCHCPACGTKAWNIVLIRDYRPTYCERCAASLKLPAGCVSDRAYCHACGSHVYRTAQQYCTVCGAEVSRCPEREQVETESPSWQPVRVVEGSIVKEQDSPKWPCPCSRRADLIRADATWCITCGRTLPRRVAAAMPIHKQPTQPLPVVRPLGFHAAKPEE